MEQFGRFTISTNNSGGIGMNQIAINTQNQINQANHAEGNKMMKPQNSMSVPFVDLKAQYRTIKTEVDAAIQNVLDSTAFVLGDAVKNFEENFARFCGVKHAVAVNSGTAALHLALLAHGIGPGDEVITVPNTFFATAEAVALCGAAPVFVDIDPATFNMDPYKIEPAITNKTKAILPVHLYGQPADMGRINEIAKRHNLLVMEDACQAHAATYKGRMTGNLADIAAFSFYPGKNLGAYGEGGMITTDDDLIAAQCRRLRSHGEDPKYTHHVVGLNYRMSGIQGAVLGVKLKYLEMWTQMRQKNAALYTHLLANSPITTPAIGKDRTHAFHLYVVRLPPGTDREDVQAKLNARGVANGLHYPIPLHMQPALKGLGYLQGNFPITEGAAQDILSLPMYPELTFEQIQYTVDTLLEVIQ